MESTTLVELEQIKDKLIQMQNIITDEILPIAQPILDKVNKDNYEFTKEENIFMDKMDDIAIDILKKFEILFN